MKDFFFKKNAVHMVMKVSMMCWESKEEEYLPQLGKLGNFLEMKTYELHYEGTNSN